MVGTLDHLAPCSRGASFASWIALLAGLSCSATASAQVSRPTLTFSKAETQASLGATYQRALGNLLDTNTVTYDNTTYNSTGFLSGGKFIRAGGGYQQPWTRDASLNSWNAGSLLAPSLASNTLWSVVKKTNTGLIVEQDNQWWDQVIWLHAAYNHYLVTGDKTFLQRAFEAAKNTLSTRTQQNFDAQVGLFKGPSFFNDGIAGYPAPPADATDSRGSFVLDYPGTENLFCLSTNAVYYQALRSAALMATAMNAPTDATSFNASADALKAKINEKFWQQDRGLYAYLLRDGQLDASEEGTGLSFVMLFGIADAAKTASILQKAHREPFGMVDVYPHFPRYSAAKPGRHNVIVWPMIQGFWAHAAARAGNEAVFVREVETLSKLATDSNGFYEIYDSQNGKTNGGWQVEKQWASEKDQTWSATAYLRMIYGALFGMTFSETSLDFAPLLPATWGEVSLTGVPYRGATLDVRLKGAGNFVQAVMLDGAATTKASIATTLTGQHTLELTLGSPPAEAGGSAGASSGGGGGGGAPLGGSGGATAGGDGGTSAGTSPTNLAGSATVTAGTSAGMPANGGSATAPATPASTPSGCGCKLAEAPNAGGLSSLALVLAASWLRRRRARRT